MTSCCNSGIRARFESVSSLADVVFAVFDIRKLFCKPRVLLKKESAQQAGVSCQRSAFVVKVYLFLSHSRPVCRSPEHSADRVAEPARRLFSEKKFP